jgi:CheY-like chemotaxis protein
MLTNTPVPHSNVRTIMIVNGGDAAIHLLDAVLDAGRYDVVFVESTGHAYSQIKRLKPSLVVLCTDFERLDGFHVLSMLKLDEETRYIPVMTCTADFNEEGSTGDDEIGGPTLETTTAVQAWRMH